MKSHFFAYIARMRFIQRWALMRNTASENVQEHSHQVAVLAHALAVIRNRFFGGTVDPGTVAVAALYHDASEILTGDMPTPVKYKTEPLRRAYKALERDAAAQLATLAPHPARRALAGYLTGDVLTEKERQLLKAADRLSALIKCIEEENTGNHEFTGAKAQQTAALHAMQCPEAEYFLEHMLPCYAWTLDELSRE